MAKRMREPNTERAPYTQRSSDGGDGTRWMLLIGLAVVLVLTGWSIAEIRGVRKDLGEKVAQLDAKIATLQTKVESGARAAAPSRGPDPNKAYTIKTDGSPAHGSPSAPILIAEFSDFQ